VTGRQVTPDDLVFMSERVYTFQRVFNLKMGYGRREHDAIPYRSVGPVTKEEYESRAERYDKQLREKVGYDPAGKATEERWPRCAPSARRSIRNWPTPSTRGAAGPRTASRRSKSSRNWGLTFPT